MLGLFDKLMLVSLETGKQLSLASVMWWVELVMSLVMSELAITVTCQSCYFSNSVFSTGNVELDTLPSIVTLGVTTSTIT